MTPLDSAFRHCRIEERDGLRLARTFTGKVPRSQSTRKHAKQDIARWSEIHSTRLPKWWSGRTRPRPRMETRVKASIFRETVEGVCEINVESKATSGHDGAHQ